MHHTVTSRVVCLDGFAMKVDRDHSWDETVITLSRGAFLLQLMASGWREHKQMFISSDITTLMTSEQENPTSDLPHCQLDHRMEVNVLTRHSVALCR